MRNPDFVQLLRREIRGALKLIPWFAVSFLLLAVFWRSDLVATTGLYQSPAGVFQSPPENTAVPASASTEVPTAEPTVPRVTATPTTEASPTVAASATPTPTVPMTPTATLTMTMQPTASPTMSPTTTPTRTAVSEPTPDPRYAEGGSNLTFDWGMLVDSLALGLSYMWLCCGVLILVGIPVVFIVLWVASNRVRQRQEPEPDPELGQEEE